MKSPERKFIDGLIKMPHSKEEQVNMLKIIDSGKFSIAEIVQILNDPNIFVCQKAGWVLQILAKHRKNLLKPHELDLIKGLESAPHDAYVRNTVRIFQDMDVSEDFEGILYDKCFAYLTSFQSPVAIKAFSLTVLRKIAVKHTDLIEELIIAIEEQMLYGTSGFNNRAAKELQILLKKKG